MKRKWIRILVGIVIIALACLIGGGIWLANHSQVIVVGQWSCPITSTAVSEYKFATADADISDTTCNTNDMQRASVTLTNGDVYPFYIEYDGAFASWDIPQGFTCTASWTDGEFTSAGTQAISGETSISLNCKDGKGHALFMKSLLIMSGQQQG